MFWREIPELGNLECTDPFFRRHEESFRQMLVRATFEDDFIFEPWVTQGPVYALPPEGPWGVKLEAVHRSAEGGGNFYTDPPLKNLDDDLSRLVTPRHVIDEKKTAESVSRIREAVGDIIPVFASRRPFWWGFSGDISTDITKMRGMEQLMMDMIDQPDRLHRLLAFMRDGMLGVYEEAERAGDWCQADQANQAMAYSQDLPDPDPDSGRVPCKQMWIFMAAQEYTLVSPAMHETFILDYQRPIMERFGLSAYGCCEDLTKKIDILRRVKNLRRIAVAPVADVKRCAEQIGSDYVISYRPNPAEMVCCGFDRDKVRHRLTEDMEALRANGCVFDVTLKDIQTVEYEPQRLRDWVTIVREVSERLG